MSAMTWKTSAKMAKELGAFTSFERNQKPMLNVISNHAFAAGVGDSFQGLSIIPPVIDWTLLSQNEITERSKKYGTRP